MTRKPISYDVPSSLEKWLTPDSGQLRTGDIVRTKTVYTGTLAGCVRQFIMKPVSQRALYEILTDQQPGLSSTILGPNDIVEIAERDDFPSE
jgi:hypothetical protein